MSWHGIEGHDAVVEKFRRALGRRRLASSFLFVGPAGIGKYSFAVKLAQALLCPQHPEEALDPCGTCPACLQVAAHSHPDLEIVAKPADRSFIPLELLVGDKQHRGREGLCHRLATKPLAGRRKIALIDDADYLNPEGANCLLKTLEEPPPQSLLILIGTSPGKQLPTIRSRCQVIRFRPLSGPLLAKLLVRQELANDLPQAQQLAERAEGSLQQAVQWADPQLWQFRQALLPRLASDPIRSVPLAREVQIFVDQAGKQPAARRQRLRQVVGLATEFYRQLLRAVHGAPATMDPELDRLLSRTLRDPSCDPETIVARLQQCLAAAEQIERNANQSTLIEAWLDRLTTAGRRHQPQQTKATAAATSNNVSSSSS